MADITEDDVTAALGAVIDPSQGKSVVELGMVGPIHIKQSNISFALEVPAHRGPAMEPVRKAAETAVRAIPGVTSATVVVTAPSGPAATSASAGGSATLKPESSLATGAWLPFTVIVTWALAHSVGVPSSQAS